MNDHEIRNYCKESFSKLNNEAVKPEKFKEGMVRTIMVLLKGCKDNAIKL